MLTKSAGNWRALKSRLFSFILGAYFTDGLRNTLIVILPVLFFFNQDAKEAAIGIGTGALLISLTDLPGNRSDKFKTACFSVPIFFLVALVMSLSLHHVWFTAAAFLVAAFLLSMLSIFGSRPAVTGLMAIILCTFTMGLRPAQPIQYAFFICAGGSWYYAISLLQISLWPYKYLNHAIFECLHSTADFLRSKSKYYNPTVSLEACYSESIALHIIVSEKQDVVRNLLLRDRLAMKPGNLKGNQLIGIAKRVIALYEQVTAIHYDYEQVRCSLLAGGALGEVERVIIRLADQLENLGHGFLPFQKKQAHYADQQMLRKKMAGQDEDSQKILRQILENLEAIELLANEIGGMRFDRTPEDGLSDTRIGYQAFLTPTVITFGFLRQAFSFRSPAFRFSLRLSLSFLAAYLLTLFFPSEKYSYWMLLTVVIVARPRFVQTWKRNKERLLGTLAGVLAAVILLYFTQNTVVLLVMSAILLLGFFAFNRTHYLFSVLCITPAILIVLNLFHGSSNDLLSGRIYYTISGCVIAFIGVYLFPIWETGQLQALIKESIASNKNYLQQVIELRGELHSESQVAGLARKNAHLHMAKLSEAILRVRYEPRRHRIDLVRVEVVQTLIYRFNAIVTSLYLLPVPIDLDHDNRVVEQKILADLNYCMHSDKFLEARSGPGETTPVVGTELQLHLLAGISGALRSYF